MLMGIFFLFIIYLFCSIENRRKMIVRNIIMTNIILVIVFATYLISYTTVFSNNLIAKQATDSVQPLAMESVSLKSMYHHAANSKATHRFQRSEINDIHTLSTKQVLKPVKGIAYRPSKKYREELYKLGKANKLIRWGNLELSVQETLQPEPYYLPDVTDHESVLALGYMSYNAYTELGGKGEWYDLGTEWRVNSSFGWESDGMRGHVFGNTDNSLLIISFKGTTAGIFNGEPTGEKDKLNDNILFSCCCGKVNRGWTPVCGCNDDKTQYQCDNQCLDKSLLKSELYYDYAAKIYMDVSDRYPDATIWLTGHSLGGAIASLVGQTFGVPAVSFESPGDQLAAQRLHLPHSPGATYMPIWHFGHTADPIFIGVCTGVTSGCFYAGFAMETRCHSGKVCVWDTVKDKGWRVNVAYHRIATIIENILKHPSEFPLPKCKVERSCEECGLWTFKDPRDDLLLGGLGTKNSMKKQSQCDSTLY